MLTDATKHIYKGVVIISWFGRRHTTPTCVLNFRHRSVARSNERHATPSYKNYVLTGDRTQIDDAVTGDVTT